MPVWVGRSLPCPPVDELDGPATLWAGPRKGVLWAQCSRSQIKSDGLSAKDAKNAKGASCRAQLAALESHSAADCEGAAEQARLYISRPWLLSRTLVLSLCERLL